MGEILTLIGLTLLPFLELRAAIPYGVFGTDLSLLTVFLVVVAANVILAPVLYWFLNNVIHVFLQVRFIDRLYQRNVVRTQNKVHKYVERYGVLGLALFIAVPLPGSGVYSGALAAYLLGFEFKDFFKAAILGVVMAAIIVMLLATAGKGLL
jgi:uncharacterized membrane protein